MRILNTRPVPLVSQDEAPAEDEGIRAKRRAKAFTDLAKLEEDVEKRRRDIEATIAKAQAFLAPFDAARNAIRLGQQELRENQWSTDRERNGYISAIRADAPGAVKHIKRKCEELVRDMMATTFLDDDDRQKRQRRVNALHELRKSAEQYLERPISADELAELEARAKQVIYR
jgi:hypothetical protein